MTSEFEERFYEISLQKAVQISLNRLGNNEPTAEEIEEFIEFRKKDPVALNSLHRLAAIVRGLEMRRVLGLPASSTLDYRDNRKAIKILKKELGGLQV